MEVRAALYLEAFEHEQRNVLLPKWNRPGKDQGSGQAGRTAVELRRARRRDRRTQIGGPFT